MRDFCYTFLYTSDGTGPNADFPSPERKFRRRRNSVELERSTA